MSDLERLVDATREAFEGVRRTADAGDTAGNSNLVVEVVEAAHVEDTATMILITPWTLDGLMFPAPGRTISELIVGRRRRQVFAGTLDGIGDYLGVNLVADVSGLADRAAARHAAAALGEPFRHAVSRAFQEQGVADPTRRDLFKRLGGNGS